MFLLPPVPITALLLTPALMDLLPYQRTVFDFHGCDRRLRDAVPLGMEKITASGNTYDWLGFSSGSDINEADIPVNILPKLASGQRPNVIDLMKNMDMALVINTPCGKKTREDGVKIRSAAMQNGIPIMNTLRRANTALRAIKSLQGREMQVRASQEYHQ